MAGLLIEDPRSRPESNRCLAQVHTALPASPFALAVLPLRLGLMPNLVESDTGLREYFVDYRKAKTVTWLYRISGPGHGLREERPPPGVLPLPVPVAAQVNVIPYDSALPQKPASETPIGNHSSKKVTVVGMGQDICGTLAMIDIDKKKLEGEAKDFLQGSAFHQHTSIMAGEL
eukprot:Skav217552  [mRNA]  locus=scaffold1602:84186:86999:+ [translate_table: standard]